MFDKGGSRSIIDGQQRLTSLTLLLIYLNNLQNELGVQEKIAEMIFSEKFGSKNFNILVEERIPCLQSLFDSGTYTPKASDDESTHNMVMRYEDIENAFPKEIDAHALPYFIDWLKEKVVLVEIIAYSDDNAYTIFETMNDRGLNLTPTEMLKGYLLSRFQDPAERQKANTLWKESIQAFHSFEKDEDQRFFQSWLRAKYAETIRPGKAGSKNEDFEKIGTRFHSWFRDNLSLMQLKPDSSADFKRLIARDFVFFRDAYLLIRKAETELLNDLDHIFYIKRWGIASSLSYPLLLAPLNPDDAPEMLKKKLNTVAKFIESFVVRRSVNFRKFSSSSIRYTMYSLVKEIRGRALPELQQILKDRLDTMEESWNHFANFRLHGQNRRFVKFLLSRISATVDQWAGKGNTFVQYHEPSDGKPFEVEHIWANKFAAHRDEFDQETDFEDYRNRLGGLVLLPRGTNQSYGAKPYAEKLEHYIKENLLVQSLCPLAYQNNPNFTQLKHKWGLPFEAHPAFNKADILKRQQLYQQICEHIWRFESPDAETELQATL